MASSTTQPSGPESGGHVALDVVLNAEPRALPVLRRAVEAVAENGRVDATAVRTAVSEALSRFILAAEPETVHVVGRVLGDRLAVEMAGRGGDADPRDSERLGLGLSIITALATEVQVHSDGQERTISMSFTGDAP